MIEIKKIRAIVSPDTQQRTYLNSVDVELGIDVLTFKDGSIRVCIKNLNEVKDHSYLKVGAYLENMDDLMVCSQINEIFKREFPKISTVLVVLSPIYSRYDRVMLDDHSDSFGAKVFANFVNSCGFNIVKYFDCHSDVLTDLTTRAHSENQSYCVRETVGDVSYNTIAPDKGALKKNKQPNLVFDKKRELSTGKILGIELIESNNVDLTKEFLVVDDLCEGGGTFLGLVEDFEKYYPNSKTNLYVTHGLFTNNAIPRLLEKYSKIYVYIMRKDTYDSLTEEQKQQLVVKYLVV